MGAAAGPHCGRPAEEPACRALLSRSLRLERVAAAYGLLTPEAAAGLKCWRERPWRAERDHNLEFRDAVAWKVAEQVLFTPERRRRLPTRAEMLDVISIDGLQRSRLDGRGPYPALFFLPTREWVRAMARLLRRLKVERPLEVGCGDGFVARCLREAGCPITACDLREGDFFITDYDEAVIQAEALEAAAALRADFILWLWPPLGCREVERLIELPHVRYYCEAGVPGERSGELAAYARFAHRRQPFLSRLGFSPFDRSDDEEGLILCNQQYLFFGRGHPRFARYEVEPSAEGPHGAPRRGGLLTD